jgi:hypothetical protein
MKNKIFVFSIGIFSILLFSGLNIPANKLLSTASVSVIAASDSESNLESEKCPFLEGKKDISCPYFNGNFEDSNSSCPYLSGKEKCPYTGKETKAPSCPYLNQDLKREGNKDNIFKMIKNTST